MATFGDASRQHIRVERLLHAVASVLPADSTMLCTDELCRNFCIVARQGCGAEHRITAATASGEERVFARGVVKVNIGGLSVMIHSPRDDSALIRIPFGVPRQPCVEQFRNDAVVRHLRWMAQKDRLGQDMFLIGPPGPSKRWLAFLFCELMKRECEFIALTRDSTESDLKQRREIRNGTAYFVDLAPVSAARHGRVLILDGLEKCERNVLPVLNNLLENREMMLEDGHFLVASHRYDKLLETHTREELDNLRLLRVHENFRVIALGVPVPLFPGNPLDPPLRSRFQCRDVWQMGSTMFKKKLFSHYVEQQLRTGEINPDEHGAVSNVCMALVELAEAIDALELEQARSASGVVTLPHFPHNHIGTLLWLYSRFPSHSPAALLDRVYPAALLDPLGAAQTTVSIAVERFLGDAKQRDGTPYRVVSGGKVGPSIAHFMLTTVDRIQHGPYSQSECVQVRCPCGPGPLSFPQFTSLASRSFVMLERHEQHLVDMLLDHAAGVDMCLIGGRGSGKTALIQTFAESTGFGGHSTMHLYRDMSARDLLQRRTTTRDGDTVWKDTPLTVAAKNGGLVVLDGIDRLAPSVLSVLQQICQERELTLFDGGRLIRQERYDALLQRVTEDELRAAQVAPVHQSFRIIATAHEQDVARPWLLSEIVPMFHFHHITPLSAQEQVAVLTSRFTNVPVDTHITPLVKLAEMVSQREEQARDAMKEEVVKHGMYAGRGEGGGDVLLSLRQMLLICGLWSAYPEKEVDLRVMKRLTSCLPTTAAEKLHHHLESAAKDDVSFANWVDASSRNAHAPESIPQVTYSEQEGLKYIHIGGAHAALHEPAQPALVPQVAFYEMPAHMRVLEQMLKDYAIANPLLLIGPQGVGKNMLADHMLQLLGVEREYIQLHRDTNVQSLTISPTLRDGVVMWEDSPLVSAVQYGRCLVVDEADKAPLEVIGVLKGLIEDHEMLLSDGRRILSPEHAHVVDGEEEEALRNVILIHPHFRIILLANKQGYPFLGNDLLSELGDCFSCHEIPNPDEKSEHALLRFYGPDVPQATISRLTLLFNDLRDGVDKGLLSYPYSTRELVGIVKHLQQFPQDGIVQAIQNVFSFDAYDAHLASHLQQVLHEHGIPSGIGPQAFASIAKPRPLRNPRVVERWYEGTKHSSAPRWNVSSAKLHEKGHWQLAGVDQWTKLETRTEGRLARFTEQKCSWTVPTYGRTQDLCVSDDGCIHVVSKEPLSLISFGPPGKFTHMRQLDLTPHLRYAVMMGGEVEEFPYEVHLSGCSESSSVVLFIPAFQFLLQLDLQQEQARVYAFCTSEAIETGHFAMYNETVYLGQNRRKGRRSLEHSNAKLRSTCIRIDGSQCSIVRTDDSSCLAVVDLDRKQQHHATWGEDISSICALESGDGTIGVLSASGTFCAARFEWHQGALQLAVKEHLGRQALAANSIVPGMSVVGLQHDLSSSTALPCNLLLSSPFMSFLASGAVGAAAVEPELPAEGAVADVIAYDGMHGDTPHSAAEMFNSLYYDEEADEIKRRSKEELEGTIGHRIVSVHVVPLRLKNTAQVANVFIARRSNKQQHCQLELIDTRKRTQRLISVPSEPVTRRGARHRQLPFMGLDGLIFAVELPNGDVATLQMDPVSCLSTIRLWEVDVTSNAESLKQWKEMLGISDESDSRATIQWDGDREATGPKEGEVDGKEHHGGNTFKGGTGGSDTAGTGGKAGPYRVDGGDDIYETTEADKQNVSPEVMAAKIAMRRELFRNKLKAIEMNQFEAAEYDRYLRRVQLQIGQLRTILRAVQAKSAERVWLKNQMAGEVDDMRLVDGLVGSRNVYKHRGELPPEQGAFQQKPKRLRFLLDCSGSMYRFNGQDHRLDRLLETTCMIMEAFAGYEHKYRYSIAGHSGDGCDIPLIDYDAPPRNNAERLKVLLKIRTHSEYCASGDTTVEALRAGIDEVIKEDADDHIVFLVSDANLKRYNIAPSSIASLMKLDHRVQCFVIFIASLADEAQVIKDELPAGRSHICLETGHLPTIFKRIFATSVLREKL